MERFEHGGDIYGHPGVLDFSASLNPLGMPAGVKDALVATAASCDAYPDPHCRQLTAAIAQREGVAESRVLVCAGATDAMTRVCLALRPERALVCAPCYSGYEQILEQVGCAIVRHELREEDSFALRDTVLASVTSGIDLVFLASPNNPTGLIIEHVLLGRIAEAAGEHGTTVVLDECFIDLADGPSEVGLLERFPNLVIVKAFTKTYAIAGLRLGYLLCANEPMVERFAACGQMWAVSTPAQVAGLAALADGGFVDRSRACVSECRAELAAALGALGFAVIPSQTNYLMFKSSIPLYEPLLERGILIRRCENFIGLDAHWFRVAVRTQEENARLIAALEEVCR